MSPDSLGWSSSATLLLLVGAVGFLLGLAGGSIFGIARKRRPDDTPPRALERREFWREGGRTSRVAIPRDSEGPSSPPIPATLPIPAVSSPPNVPLAVPPVSQVDLRPIHLHEGARVVDGIDDPIDAMTDAEIDAMPAEVPVRDVRRRRRTASAPKPTMHRL